MSVWTSKVAAGEVPRGPEGEMFFTKLWLMSTQGKEGQSQEYRDQASQRN